MVTLYFNRAAVHGAAGTAALFQARREFIERVVAQRHAGNDRDTLALAAFGFPADAHDTVIRRSRGRLRRLAALAPAVRNDAAALGAKAALPSGINDPAVLNHLGLIC